MITVRQVAQHEGVEEDKLHQWLTPRQHSVVQRLTGGCSLAKVVSAKKPHRLTTEPATTVTAAPMDSMDCLGCQDLGLAEFVVLAA